MYRRKSVQPLVISSIAVHILYRYTSTETLMNSRLSGFPRLKHSVNPYLLSLQRKLIMFVCTVYLSHGFQPDTWCVPSLDGESLVTGRPMSACHLHSLTLLLAASLMPTNWSFNVLLAMFAQCIILKETYSLPLGRSKC